MFYDWGIPNTDYAKEDSKAPVTARQYTKRDLSPQAVLEVLELITEICDFLHKKRRMKRAELSFETPYDTVLVSEVREYLQLLAEGGLKEELATKDAT